MTEKRKYDSTIARIAGNVLYGLSPMQESDFQRQVERQHVEFAVRIARAIVAEVERTEPTAHD